MTDQLTRLGSRDAQCLRRRFVTFSFCGDESCNIDLIGLFLLTLHLTTLTHFLPSLLQFKLFPFTLGRLKAALGKFAKTVSGISGKFAKKRPLHFKLADRFPEML